MYFTTLVVSGVANGCLYALVALGLVLIYKSQDMINWVQGEFLLVGGFAAYIAIADFGLSYWLAFPIGVLAGSVLGLFLEVVLVRRVADQPHMTLVMLTLGMSIMIKGFARIPFSDIYTLPPLIGGSAVNVLGVRVAPQTLLTIGASLGLAALLFLLFRFSSFGRQMVATQQNRRGAQFVGINVDRVYSLTWVIAAAIGAAAGILTGPTTLLFPDMGNAFLLKAFAAAVLGGFSSAPGAIVGGIAIGVIEMLCGGYLDTKLIEVSSYIIIIVVMFVRPNGLFGKSSERRV
jgi:branched-chain amino acid transport system permease protein